MEPIEDEEGFEEWQQLTSDEITRLREAMTKAYNAPDFDACRQVLWEALMIRMKNAP